MMTFKLYPFEKLRILLQGIKPHQDIIDLTIGEPQFDTPKFIQKELKKNSFLLNKYPKSSGELSLKNSMINFMDKRFNVQLNENQLIPTLGTREVLFNFPQFYLADKKNSKMAFTNPFYQIYEGSAIASKSKIRYINLTEKNQFKPKIKEKLLKNIDIVILNFPNNPTTSVLNFNDLKKWIKLSEKYNFLLINDECYSEIYFKTKPISLLEVAQKIGKTDFKNLLVLNSISKRSSAPSLRSGFIAGDSTILNSYKQYRTYLGTAIPLPLQKASAVAWNDMKHSEKIRKIYKKNFKLAKEILGITPPKATFYLWIKVKNDLKITKKLYKQGIKVLAGRFLGSAGKGYIRIALVHKPKITKKALRILKHFL